ncbi:CD109 antigen-like isoform X2 [Ruditapes philippinarum]|uniref:CD109 antigen-like isoform X2 n=1 Tax=Ruditapes philippinarum TaxID=129788 RepID=UPI00295A7638|nr:CD109 antigen-like isoform X2 [Ruditapes philippinarum]
MLLAVLILLTFETCHAATSNGTHWIVVPDKYTPGVPLPVTFTFYNTSGVDVKVQLDLLSDSHHRVTSLTHTFKEGKPGLLQLQVPNLSDNPETYSLLINGLRGLFFQEHAILHHDSGDISEMFAVHIQTDKGIYKPGQTVRFRTFGISSTMLVYTGQLNISITDPKGNIMKNMVNVSESNYGVIEDYLIMDSEPVLGTWTITAKVKDRADKVKHFIVQKYVLPKFDIKIELPSYVVTTDNEMHGTVKATYSYGKPVIGTVKLYADTDYGSAPWKYNGGGVMVELTFNINGEAKFTVPFSRIRDEADPNTYEPLVQKLANYHLTIKASVTESINNITRNATAQVKFYKVPFRLSFDTAPSMMFFKPGLTYHGRVSLTQADGNPVISSLPEVTLVTYVKYYDPALHSYNAHYLREQTLVPPATGSLSFSVDPPENVDSLHIKVEFRGLSDMIHIKKPYWVTEAGNIQIKLNSKQVTVGHNASFLIQKARELTHEHLFYAVVANDRIVHSGVVYDDGSSSVPLSFVATEKMKPHGKLIVYYFTNDEWNADATYFQVQDSSKKFRNKIALSFNKATAEPGDSVSLSVSTNPMSLVNMLAVDQSVMYLAKGNDITGNDIISSLMVKGQNSQDSIDLHAPKDVLKTKGIHVLTDVKKFNWANPMYRRQLNCDCESCPSYNNNLSQCQLVRDPSNPCCRIPQCSFAGTGGTMTGGTGTMSGAIGCMDRIPNCAQYGKQVCSNGAYQSWVSQNCVQFCALCSPPVFTSHKEPLKDKETCEDKISDCIAYGREVCSNLDYRSWVIENCGNYCGLCALQTQNIMTNNKIEHTRDTFLETWIWTNFTVGPGGSKTLTYTVPDTITSWYTTAFSVNTQSGLGVTDGPAKLTTFRPFFISLNLPYSVVRGEEVVIQANVFNYMGQDLDVVVTLEKSDDFKAIDHDSPGHTVFVSKDITKTIHIEAGQAESVFIPVVANIIGAAKVAVKAQSVLSGDRVIKDLIVVAEGTPMHFNIPVILNEHTSTDIPLSFPPSFVADSQKVQISVIGDTMGPTLKNLKKLLRMPTGCGEQTMTSLAPDVFVYNYLRKTGQLTQALESRILEYVMKGYQRELTFQRSDGSFSIWGQQDTVGSMWLTAFVLKSFHQAKGYVYVSQDVLNKATNWIMRYQNTDGSFKAVGSVHSTSLQGGSRSRYSLTAFVLIALAEVRNSPQNLDSNFHKSIVTARRFLERAVYNDNVTDIYDLAIVSYALSRTGSVRSYVTYKRLERLATRTREFKMYWNLTKTPHQSSWEYNYYQSPPLEVEVASYALLYLIDSRQLSTGYPIMRWLVSQRNSLGGFRSTQDTVLGLQAMSEYGALFKDSLDLNIAVSSDGFVQQVHIEQADAMVLKLIDIPHSAILRGNNSGNHVPAVTLTANGRGSVLVQVSVTFNVESEVSLPAFNITYNIFEETIRSMVIRACARYLPQRFTSAGMAVMEIDIPSGFSADLESSKTKLDNAKKTEIRDEKTVVLYYDEILPTYPSTCANLELLRTDLVAKTKPAAIRVFDYYKPENRALAFYQSTLLKDTSVCDVCSTCGCI